MGESSSTISTIATETQCSTTTTLTTSSSNNSLDKPTTLTRDDSLGLNYHHYGPSSSSRTSLVVIAESYTNLYFAEANSELELQDICRRSNFELQTKEHNITVVDVQRVFQEQGVADQRDFTWTWECPIRNRVEDDHFGRKTVFAFLHRNPSSGNIDVLSQFSLWFVGSHAMDQSAMRPFQRLVPQNKGHWRRASTPERFASSLGRPPSFTKGVSNLSTHTSLPRLSDLANGGSGIGMTTADASVPNSSSSFNLNNSTPVDTEDGPLFRATVVECENYIRDMKAATKRIIRAAQTVLETRRALVVAEETFVKELEAFKPAEPLMNNYLRPMSQSLTETSESLSNQMRSLLIEPLTRFYINDIKMAETHKKTFDDESKEYYQYLSRYMAIKHESSRKKSEADAKYERKRKQFEFKRFEYWGFLLDMRAGGSKSDEILHHLINYSEKHCRNLMNMALLAENRKPSLDILDADLMESHKKAAATRKERQERRKELVEVIDGSLGMTKNGTHLAGSFSGIETLLDGDTTNTTLLVSDDQDNAAATAADQRPTITGSSPMFSAAGSSQLNNNSTPKFGGIRDLEHQDIDANSALGRRKEGFLFATSRPSMHNNSVVLEKPSLNWHKYWCVVSDGFLHEYSHWKKGVTMLHNEPINLKISAVRPCRNQDRRFCFEVITPKYRRVYQATSAEDMNSWVSVISNAIQSLLDGTGDCNNLDVYNSGKDSKLGGGIPGVDGLIASMGGGSRTSIDQQANHATAMERQLAANAAAATNGFAELLGAQDAADSDHHGTRLLKIMRESHTANNFCAECGAKNPDWCAINLGNDVSNRVWEANLVQTPPLENQGGAEQHSNKIVFRRPLVNDTREYKVSFIQKKYVERAFVNRQKFSEHADADGTMEPVAILATKALFLAASANSIPDVIEAFAAGADLNAIQESEETIESDILATPSGTTDGTGSGLESTSDCSSGLSRSTIESSGADVSGDQEQQATHLQETLLTSITDHYGSSFMIMQTSPLLLALHHGVPFSLDEQYEVYPLAEFMLQNGAMSNLSVEVRLIEEDTEGSSGQATAAEINNTSLAQQSTFLLSTDGDNNNNSNNNNNNIVWDSTQVDPEDIRNHHIRNNRRSLGEVVHMRGEGGATAMEYLRAKSAARGEPMPGSPPIHTGNSNATGYMDCHGSSGSPPSTTYSSRHLRTQNSGVSPSIHPSSPPVITSPMASISSGHHHQHPGVIRQHSSTSTHQDISALFQRRRESDGAIGSSSSQPSQSMFLPKATIAEEKKSGSYKLQNVVTLPFSSATQNQQQPQHHLHSFIHHSNSRAHKVKATLTKRLRLSAAYIKNNMMKEEKEYSVPTITQTNFSTSPPNSTTATTTATTTTTTTGAGAGAGAGTGGSKQAAADAISVFPTGFASNDGVLVSPSNTEMALLPESSLSEPYVILHKKGTTSPTSPVPSSGLNTGTP
ncbi:hypothetical protein BGZ65_012948 [Modicella reniformis]|uniref:PH domain-containing protein n=1 Tax=Modicella reniformis TaxID=1440133 RepID=A0A9P6SUW2_9FUNG|nr:hypothetical protein BGZ65_012948 [Modicella reniformis]